MVNSQNYSVFIVHYTKLKNRKSHLSNYFEKCNIESEWITETNYDQFKSAPISEKNILGVPLKILGMDLGVSSRSLVFSRRKARFQGYVLFIRSYISHKNNLLTTGSLPKKKVLPKPQLEVQRMHITSLKRGIEANSKWPQDPWYLLAV
jgi:hypothetical protein